MLRNLLILAAMVATATTMSSCSGGGNKSSDTNPQDQKAQVPPELEPFVENAWCRETVTGQDHYLSRLEFVDAENYTWTIYRYENKIRGEVTQLDFGPFSRSSNIFSFTRPSGSIHRHIIAVGKNSAGEARMSMRSADGLTITTTYIPCE